MMLADVGGNSTLGALVLGGTLVYLAPTFVASFRRKANTNAIFALNVLTGWTFVGWVGSLVWALTAEPRTWEI